MGKKPDIMMLIKNTGKIPGAEVAQVYVHQEVSALPRPEKELKSFEKIRALRWRCTQCGHVKRVTRPMPAEVAPPCPKCRSDSFAADP